MGRRAYHSSERRWLREKGVKVEGERGRKRVKNNFETRIGTSWPEWRLLEGKPPFRGNPFLLLLLLSRFFCSFALFSRSFVYLFRGSARCVFCSVMSWFYCISLWSGMFALIRWWTKYMERGEKGIGRSLDTRLNKRMNCQKLECGCSKNYCSWVVEERRKHFALLKREKEREQKECFVLHSTRVLSTF